MKYIFSMFITTYSFTSYSLHSSYVLVSVLYNVQNGSFQSVYANQLKSVMPQLSVDKVLVYLDGARIILPKNAVKSVLPLLHV